MANMNISLSPHHFRTAIPQLESLRLDLRCAAVSYQRPPVMDRGLARFLASPKTTHLSTVNPPPPLIFALPNCSYITYVVMRVE